MISGGWLNISRDKYWFLTKNFGKHLANVYVYLWLRAAPYNYTNTASIWLHGNDLIHSVHKEITLYKLFINQLFTTYVTTDANRPDKGRLNVKKLCILHG